MRSSTRLLTLALGAGLAVATPATAEVVDGFLEFTVGGFQANDPAAPKDPLTGRIRLTFDTSISVNNSTAGVVVDVLNLSPTSALAFSYNAAQDILTVGGLDAGTSTLGATGTDIMVTVQNLFGGNGPLIVFGAYFIEPDAFSSGLGSGRARMVPEPASALLLGAGLLGLGATLRRRRD